ncbi:exported hypothetical protein [Syntrophobacter sp. SbD1]|nr:exported hypothetical protein [Syntrophobacter sp. SbD1]
MGYLITLSIGFGLGWLSAAILSADSRVKLGPGGGHEKKVPGVDPVF